MIYILVLHYHMNFLDKSPVVVDVNDLEMSLVDTDRDNLYKIR